MTTGMAFLLSLILAAGGALTPQTVRLFGAVTFPDGSPAANVRLVLERDGDVVASVETDADGNYTIEVTVAPGTYRLFARRGGLEADAPVTLVRGEPLRVDLRLRELPMTSGAPPDPVPPPPPPPPKIDQSPGPVPTTADPDSATTVVQVFYATDRAQAGRAGEFQNVRAAGGSLTLGRIDVNIPPGHRLGEIERPSWWTIRRDDPDRFFMIVNRTVDSYEGFYQAMSERIRSSPDRDAFVFIHGYNVTFDDAVFRAAQIAHDLTFMGAPIVYSWPSRATLIGYPHDQTAAEQTIHQLKWFLTDVANRTGASTIHLIGHSMGNYPLSRAVTELAGRPELQRFKHVILTAPDIDAVVFKEHIAPALARSGARVTLYASSADSALRASKLFNGARRAGDSTEPLVINGIDTIDASNVVTDFLGHSPFVPSVLMDIFALLRQGQPPDQRFGMRTVPVGALRYWIFRPISP